jgi:Na+/H+ antiporter NhaA
MSQLPINACHYSKKVKVFGLRGWLVLFILLSLLNIFSIKQHAILLIATIIFWFIEKKRGYVIEYYILYLRTKLGGRCRRN